MRKKYIYSSFNPLVHSIGCFLILLFCAFHTHADSYAQEVSIQAQATSPQTVILRWQLKSAAETVPISYFEVERSIDGRNFTTIETIQSNDIEYYSFVDKKAFASRLHYRLKILNTAGKTTYSDIMPVDVILTLASNQFVPSTVETSYIKIHLPSTDLHATVQIYDADGVLYFSVEADKSPLIIDINGWQNGEYFVHFRSAQRTEVNKMLVER
ncbi:T9SS type A sorting domain-containing protein [Bernardetia sp. MNP-M8]|uniref:T9SS type A sorting domain-containing protein n=1 Tax=Bernardetia sp. MNP-M8 TaxID=3127470 RepID=UPI0030D243B5